MFYADKTICKENALNSEVFLGKLFSKESKHTSPCWAAGGSLWISQHPQQNQQKVLNLKLFMHCILTPWVINKVHIGPQFEYIIEYMYVLVFPNSSKVKNFNKQQRVIHVTAAERTRGRDEAAHIARL